MVHYQILILKITDNCFSYKILWTKLSGDIVYYVGILNRIYPNLNEKKKIIFDAGYYAMEKWDGNYRTKYKIRHKQKFFCNNYLLDFKIIRRS